VREGCDESQGYLHSRPLAKIGFWRAGSSVSADAARTGAISEAERALDPGMHNSHVRYRPVEELHALLDVRAGRGSS